MTPFTSAHFEHFVTTFSVTLAVGRLAEEDASSVVPRSLDV
jgi:hypothetical protein